MSSCSLTSQFAIKMTPSNPDRTQRSMSCVSIPMRTMSLRSRQAEHPTVSLELPQLDRYHDRAERALTETITAYGNLGNNVDNNRWKSLRSRHGIRLFRGRYLNCEGQTPLLCVGTLRGRFDDVMEGLYCDNTDEMLLMNAVKCPRLAESAVLYAVQKKTVLEPYAFTGIKWTTIKMSVASNRDLCYFDKMGMIRQRSGKRMAYHVMQSVDLPECPHKSMHKRVRVSLCYLLEELEDDLDELLRLQRKLVVFRESSELRWMQQTRVQEMPIQRIQGESSGHSVEELRTAQNGRFCKIEEEYEDVNVDIQGSDRSLTSFVRKISAQMQELSIRGENRASSLSSMGKALEEDLDEGQDVLNSSRLKTGQFVVLDKNARDMSRRSRSSTISTSSSYDHEDEDPEQFKATLFAKLQQVANQAEETLFFAREQSLVALGSST